MRSAVVRIAALAAAALVLPACASDASSSENSSSITVFAAASLTETFTTLGEQFEHDHPGTAVVFNFGPSSTLATQIQQGAPADVFASASPTNMDALVESGDAENPVTFVTNSMAIATPPGNPAHVDTVSDLSTVKVAVCDPSVPCGKVAAAVFGNAGIEVKPVSLETDVKSTLSKVELGEVDAGMVYVTDVKAAGDKVVGVAIPDAINASTSYPIAALADATDAALAAAFVSYVQSTAARKVFTEAGFGSP